MNILTHLINDRVLELIADGQPTLREAIAQAEDELVAALAGALPIADLNEFSELSLYDSATSQNNTLGNAYLLALSTGFYKYAKTKAQEFGTATDAELTLVLNRISDDLADDGRLQPGPFIGEFVTAIRSLSPETIAANLRSRSLVDYPQGLGVPDISVFLEPVRRELRLSMERRRSDADAFDRPRNRRACWQDLRVWRLDDSRGPCCSDEVDAYDPVANEWTPKRRMPRASPCRRPYDRRQDLRGRRERRLSSAPKRALCLRPGRGPVVCKSASPDVQNRFRERGRQRFALCHRRSGPGRQRSRLRHLTASSKAMSNLRPGDRSLVDGRTASHGAHAGSSLRSRRSDLCVRRLRASPARSGRS